VRSLPTAQYRYTDDVLLPALVDRARQAGADDGLDAEHLLVVGGGLDGIERVLEVHLRLGDRVGVEDPGYPGSLDLVRALGLEPVGIEVDDQGLVPDALDAALAQGITALLHVPRAQNPTGAALTDPRAAELRRCLAAYPEVLVIEDDHAAPIAGAPAVTLTAGRARWAVVRSVAKWLGPQLRLGILFGDEATTDRVLARQRLGVGWVSQLLQHLVAVTWEQAEADGTLRRATAAYAERRGALLAALGSRGIAATGRSGLNVWIPVEEEVPVVQGLAELGWGVAAGEAFRLDSGPGVRVTTALLPTADAAAFAADLERVLDQRLAGRRG
jgi:DNA-binding transcriptional MocR family regulator